MAYGVAASLLTMVPVTDVDVLSSLGGGAVFVWLPMVIGLWVTARGQMLAGLQERAERLEQEQTARAEQARAQERGRIARDMHDVVAHHVSLMVLHAGALEINAPDERTAAQAELIRATGKEALSQLRGVLGVLSEPHSGCRSAGQSEQTHVESQPTLADLDTLLEQSRSAGVPVHHMEEGRPFALPAMVEHTAYRIVQESLTNIHTHAGGSVAHVTLRYLPTALEVTVANTAAAGDPAAMPGSGLGLTGLRERVSLLGGQLIAEAAPGGGFSVSATIPT